MKDQGLSCVRSVGPELKGFFAGEDKDLVRIVDCVSGALAKFADNTRGANPDGWTRGELSSFFETYFKEESNFQARVPEKSIEPSDSEGEWNAQARRRVIVTELFRWKSSLFGGGETTLSRAELARVQALLVKLRTPLAVWRGQGKILSLQADQPAGAFDMTAVSRLTTSIRQMGEILAAEFSIEFTPKKNGHSFRDPMKLQTLINSFEQTGITLLEAPERKQVLQAVKKFVLGGDSQQIAGEEWGELFLQASELWIGAIRIQYGILQNPNFRDRDLAIVDITAADLVKSLKRMIARHGGVISNDEIRDLLNLLEANKFLPGMVHAKSVNASLEVIFGKLLAGNWNQNKLDLAKGLQASHAMRVLEVVNDWSEGQRVVQLLAGVRDTISVDQVKLAMSRIGSEGQVLLESFVRLQFSELVLRGRPLVSDQQGRLLILPTDDIANYRRQDLDELNLTRVLMSAAMRAYSHEMERALSMPEITESEIQELFMDLKAIGRDLGVVDVRSLQSGFRTFMEANIFLSVSDGNAFISLHEMVEWFQTVISAGRAADLIHADLVSEEPGAPRCGVYPLDVFGKPRILAKCFRENVIPVFKNRLSHLPNFIKALDEAEKQNRIPQFLKALEQATRALGDSDLPLESSETRVMSPVIHYAEALFARYDVNRTAKLETREVWSVFPLIQPFIKKLAVDADGAPINLTDGEERAIFSWLLDVGAPPGSSWGDIIDLKRHQIAMWFKDAVSFRFNLPVLKKKIAVSFNREQAEFSDIIKILASFNGVGRAKKNKDVIKYYLENTKAWEDGIARADALVLAKTLSLFQCSREAESELNRLLQFRRSDIFAKNPGIEPEPQAKIVVDRLKSMIQANPQLQLLCMAF